MKKHVDISDEMLDRLADRFKTLGDSTRLRILRVLIVDGQSTVSQVVDRAGGGFANTSKQLKRLYEAGIITRKKYSPHVFYEVSDASLVEICRLVCDSIRTTRKRFG